LLRWGGSVGTLISFATAIGRTASDGSEYSPYSEALAKTIPLPNITISQALQKTRKLVLQTTNREQVPWERSALIEDFYFKKRNGTSSHAISNVIPDVNIRTQQVTSLEKNIWNMLKNKRYRMAYSIAERFMSKNLQKGGPIVAYFLLKGLGTEKNLPKALKILSASAKAGNSNAAYFLATLYYKGKYFTLNLKAAEKWLTKAAELGHVRARKLVKNLNH
jgi:TPR repeat protein